MSTHRICQYYVSLRKPPSTKPVLVSRYCDTLDEAKELARNILEEEHWKMFVAIIKRATTDSTYDDSHVNFRDPVGFFSRAYANDVPTWFPWKTNHNSPIIKGD